MIEIKGNWHKGFAYDLHTLGSDFIGYDEYGHPQFDTTYSDMGTLLHDLKYRSDKEAVSKIAELLERAEIVEGCDLIIPAPASKFRRYQPVDEVVLELGRRTKTEVMIGVLAKASGKELKGIHDPDERMDELRKTISFNAPKDISGRSVLLFDDLYRSGVTLAVCTEILCNQGKVKLVSVLTMTKTRRNR